MNAANNQQPNTHGFSLQFSLFPMARENRERDQTQNHNQKRTALKFAFMLLFCFGVTVVWNTAVLADETSGDELDLKVKAIIEQRCVMCHDDLGEDSAGGDINYLLKFEELLGVLIDTDDPGESYLLELVPDEMPKEKMRGGIAWNGQLSEEELADFKEWVNRGGPSKKYMDSLSESKVRATISLNDLSQMIVQDMGKLKSNQLKNARYLTLFNLHNNPDVTDESLQQFRDAINKLLNSLSSQAEVVVPTAIDEQKTTFRFDIRDLGWDENKWDMIAKCYPYEITQKDGFAATLYQATSSDLPYMRADWFAFAVTQPPLYHELVNIPPTLGELDNRLFGTPDARVANIRAGKVIRAGFGDSGVSQNNRLIERHSIPTGAYWISYDFAANHERQNLMTHPLGPNGVWPTQILRQHEFEHDGGEVIFNLPNGFQAYGLYDAKGGRIDVGPSNIVHDDTMTGGAIINGVSCISCHNRGMKPENQIELVKLDRVRKMTQQNFRRFDEDTRMQIAELYPEGAQFAKRVREDRKRFESAMEKANVPLTGDEPVRKLFNQFIRDIDLNSVSAELGMTTESLKTLLDREGETRQVLLRLEDEGVKRQLFLNEFKMIVRLTGIGNVRDSSSLNFPFFGQQPASSPSDKKEQNQDWPRQSNAGQQTGIPIIDEDNVGSDLQVSLETVGGKKHFKEGEKVQFVLSVSEDSFVRLISTDSENNVTVLLPNKWHSGRIKAGAPTIFPTQEMGFEFFVEPPFGRTLIKATATHQAQHIKGLSDRFETEGLVQLGTTKSLKVRGIRTESGAASLQQALPTNQWGTARFTLITKPK